VAGRRAAPATPPGSCGGRARYAIERGCHGAFLGSFSFQARPLYEKLGYEVFGALDDFPPGHRLFLLKKRLTAEPP
jgi:hypothetical protein